MRTPLALFGLLLALSVGGFALASVGGVSSVGDRQIYVPLIAHGFVANQATVVPNDDATATATSTATSTATNTATSTATSTATATATDPSATPANCDAEADLTGILLANNQGQITNSSADCSYEVGLASYRAFDKHIRKQQLFDSAIATIPPGQTLDLTVAVPDCTAQIDLFYGPLLLSLDGQRYGERLLASRWIVGSGYCAPGSTPQPTATPTQTGIPAATPTPTRTATPTRTPSPNLNGAIGDRVWLDTDGDTIQDSSEVSVGNVTVYLYTSDGDDIFEPGTGDTLLAQTITNTDVSSPNYGFYGFNNLPPGLYWVSIDVPGGYALMTSNPYPLIDLGSGEIYLDADFGIARSGG